MLVFKNTQNLNIAVSARPLSWFNTAPWKIWEVLQPSSEGGSPWMFL